MNKLCIALALLVLCAVSAFADTMSFPANSQKSFYVSPKVGFRYITNSDYRDTLGNQFGISAEILPSANNGNISVGWFKSEKKHDDLKMTSQSIPLLAGYKQPFSAGGNVYFTAATGVAFNRGKAKMYDMTSSQKNNCFAIKAGVGAKTAAGFFCELTWSDFGKIGDYKNKGAELDLGWTF